MINSDEYKLKRFFYALRASVACLWIIEREDIPPIEFCGMLGVLDLPEKLIKRIKELIELKSIISETYLHSGEQELIAFMKSCIARAGNEYKNLPAAKGEMSELNEFFRSVLG